MFDQASGGLPHDRFIRTNPRTHNSVTQSINTSREEAITIIDGTENPSLWR
jgi:hypothetical protein